MTWLIAATALFSVSTGAGVLFANPRRFLNQTFAFGSLLIAVWMWMVFKAANAGVQLAIDPGSLVNPVPWLRANTGLAAFFPGSSG